MSVERTVEEKMKALYDAVEAIKEARATDYPIRQHSAHTPKPASSIERVCRTCGASFIGLAPGKTGERGIWTEPLIWYCSVECYEALL